LGGFDSGREFLGNWRLKNAGVLVKLRIEDCRLTIEKHKNQADLLRILKKWAKKGEGKCRAYKIGGDFVVILVGET
jgi:hypothetical protein